MIVGTEPNRTDAYLPAINLELVKTGTFGSNVARPANEGWAPTLFNTFLRLLEIISIRICVYWRNYALRNLFVATIEIAC